MSNRHRTGDQTTAIDADVGDNLAKALKNCGISVIYQNPAGQVVWTQNVDDLWDGAVVPLAHDANFLPEKEAERLRGLKQEVFASGASRTIQLSVPGEDGAGWFDLWVDADRSEIGEVRGFLITIVETTEQKRREQTLRTLLREVSHRSKNLLSIIQSIATQTGRYSGTIDSFLSRFRGRIQSLASSQDLVTSSNWRGANLHELVAGQIFRYCADPQRNIRLKGDNPYFTPNAALHVGLALHELAVNSVSYGTLASGDGFVTIAAERTEAGERQSDLVLTWSEASASDPDAEPEKRFGSVALERVVPASLGGSASLQFGPDHVEYRLIVPATNFENE